MDFTRFTGWQHLTFWLMICLGFQRSEAWQPTVPRRIVSGLAPMGGVPIPQLNYRPSKEETIMKSELARWDPFRELEEVHNRLASFFDSGTRSRDREESILATAWAPLVDISEDDKSYTLKVELPEMKREDIKVNVENGILTISGERLREKEEENRRYHRVERAYGNFVRNFTLPQNVDSTKVNATYRDGVLHVNIEKAEHARPQSIEVKVD